MTKHTGPSELIGSTTIATWIDTSRSQAWRLMKSGAFGDLVDISPQGALRSQLRARRSGVERWLEERRLSA